MNSGDLIRFLCADKKMTYPKAGYVLSIERASNGAPSRIMQTKDGSDKATEWKPTSRDLLRGDWESA